MKKLSIVGMSALLMLAVSCQKEKGQKLELQGNGFYATAEMHQSNSKTHLNGSAVNWDANDAVLVFNQAYPAGYVFTASQVDAQDPTKALLTNDNVPDEFYAPAYKALYPNAMVTKVDNGFQLTLPATQNAVYNNGKFIAQFANGANPMGVCNATDENLYFQNLCGILDLQLYSTTARSITKIELTNNGEGNVSGKALVNLDGQNPVLGDLDGSNKTITLNCNSQALSTNANEPSHFYFVLPAGTLDQGFTVKVYKTNGDIWTKTATAGNNTTIERSVITVMDKIEVTDPVIVVPEGAIPGLFSVSPTKKVFFSKGYLYYDEVNTDWHFWNNQTDYDTKGYDPEGNKVSLFTWGYGTWSADWDTDQCAEANATSSSFVDWGVNPIVNGGNVANQWFTLTSEEWDYMLGARFTDEHGQPWSPYESGHYTHWDVNSYEPQHITASCVNLSINGVYGLLIYADDYVGERFRVWQNLTAIPEKCAFLACAGYREKNGSHDYKYLPGYPGEGHYTTVWTKNVYQWYPNECSTGLSFPAHYDSFNVCNFQNRTFGYPVRLVQEYVPSNN